MSRYLSSAKRWDTQHSLSTDEFEHGGRWYSIKAEVTVEWLDDSDYDREYGYGTYIAAERITVDSLEVAELDPDSEAVLCAEVSDCEVLRAASEWAEQQAEQEEN